MSIIDDFATFEKQVKKVREAEEKIAGLREELSKAEEIHQTLVADAKTTQQRLTNNIGDLLPATGRVRVSQ